LSIWCIEGSDGTWQVEPLELDLWPRTLGYTPLLQCRQCKVYGEGWG
jgi:hypothetical protein